MTSNDSFANWGQPRSSLFLNAANSVVLSGTDNEEPAFQPYIPRGESTDKTIWAPNKSMIEVHSRLRAALEYDRPLFLDPAYGGLAGGSPAMNIRPHVANRYFYQLDFANAYSQVDLERMAKTIVDGRGTRRDVDAVKSALEEYCFAPVGQGLARGAPSSPYLFNLYCEALDWELSGYTDSAGITYTRYLDDLTFSKPDNGFQVRDTITAKERSVIRTIITDFGMNLSPKKTRVSDVRKAPVTITGLQLDRNGQWHIKSKTAEEARERLLSKYTLFGGTLLQKDVRDLAAGYKGMLDAAEHGKKRSKSERRLGTLVSKLLIEIPAE